jgi:hypothetical protein
VRHVLLAHLDAFARHFSVTPPLSDLEARAGQQQGRRRRTLQVHKFSERRQASLDKFHDLVLHGGAHTVELKLWQHRQWVRGSAGSGRPRRRRRLRRRSVALRRENFFRTRGEAAARRGRSARASKRA